MVSLWHIRQRLFENLRMLPHAPGVQMQAIPEDAVPDDNVNEDREDPDKRLSSMACTESAICLNVNHFKIGSLQTHICWYPSIQPLIRNKQ